jgi:hypothetical protein
MDGGRKPEGKTFNVFNNHKANTYHNTGRLSLASTGRYWPLLASLPCGPFLPLLLLPLSGFGTAFVQNKVVEH